MRPAAELVKTQRQRRAAKDRQYAARRRVFLEQNPTCAAAIPDLCTGQATQVHHVISRSRWPGGYLEESNWAALCQACHQWITEHPRDAEDSGWSRPSHARGVVQ